MRKQTGNVEVSVHGGLEEDLAGPPRLYKDFASDLYETWDQCRMSLIEGVGSDLGHSGCWL